MRKTNKNLTKQILTLMLAFIMVFTGMGIGSWGVDTAWADTTTQPAVNVTTSDLSNKVGKYTGCLGEADIYFIKLQSNTEKLTFATEIKKQTVWPYVNINSSDEDLTELAYIDAKYTMYQNGDTYQLAKNDYDPSKVIISEDVKLDDTADHLLLMLYYYDDSFDFLLVEWGKAEKVVDTELKAAIEKVPKSGYYTTNDRYNGKQANQNGFWEEMQFAFSTARDLFPDDACTQLKAGVLQSQVDKATADLEAAIANLIPKSQLNATNLYEVIQECKKNYPDDYLEFFTQATAKNLKAALADAEKYLALLFNEKKTEENPNGANRTENVFANQGKADGYAKALNTARSELVHVDTFAKAQDDASLIQALAKRFSMTENNGKYTDESWNAFTSAREEALT